MGNPLKKTMVFLGLAEEELDDQQAPAQAARAESEPTATATAAATAAAARPVQRAHVTPLRKVAPARQVAPQAMNEILTVHPTEFRDAQAVAVAFREGVPVILNLTRMNEAEARRLIDFASGLTMGLSGSIERVTSKVFLLTPEHVVTSQGEEPQQSEGGSFFVSATA